jgi:hypothetical protein
VKPYVICQGDYLLSLAYRFSFDADAVWNDPKNADVKQARKDPNMLCPGDILYIPETKPTKYALAVGATNSFVANPTLVPVTVTFADAAFASQACTIQELTNLGALATDAAGALTCSVPVTLEAATIHFTKLDMTHVLKIGHLDPPDTLFGVYQRLQNLGFIAPDARYDSSDVDFVRRQLRAFKATQRKDDGCGARTPDSRSSQRNDEEPSPAQPDPPDDNAGLSDEGTLDASTAAMLLKAHGS